MPFDPQWPQNGQLVDADRFRDQFTSLKSLIDAIQGGGITGAQVDGVTTLDPGQPASVNVSVVGSTLHFSFDIPRGSEGQPGDPGPVGPQGPTGEVSAAEVANAVNLGIQGTSNNSNGVGQMSISVDPSYNPSQMQAVFDKVDELILALRR